MLAAVGLVAVAPVVGLVDRCLDPAVAAVADLVALVEQFAAAHLGSAHSDWPSATEDAFAAVQGSVAAHLVDQAGQADRLDAPAVSSPVALRVVAVVADLLGPAAIETVLALVAAVAVSVVVIAQVLDGRQGCFVVVAVSAVDSYCACRPAALPYRSLELLVLVFEPTAVVAAASGIDVVPCFEDFAALLRQT